MSRPGCVRHRGTGGTGRSRFCLCCDWGAVIFISSYIPLHLDMGFIVLDLTTHCSKMDMDSSQTYPFYNPYEAVDSVQLDNTSENCACALAGFDGGFHGPGNFLSMMTRASRPVSLLSCLGKGFDWRIARRRAWISVLRGVLYRKSPAQEIGGRPGCRTTNDNDEAFA